MRNSSERVCGANGADLFHIHFHDVRSKTKHRVSHSLHAESIGGSWSLSLQCIHLVRREVPAATSSTPTAASPLTKCHPQHPSSCSGPASRRLACQVGCGSAVGMARKHSAVARGATLLLALVMEGFVRFRLSCLVLSCLVSNPFPNLDVIDQVLEWEDILCMNRPRF